MWPSAKKTIRCSFAIVVLGAIGCEAAPTMSPTSPVKSTLSIEERAVRDALERFVRKTQVSEITVEPTPYLSGSPAKIGGAAVTVMTRKQLADQHAGDEIAPTITTIDLYRPKREPAAYFDVSIGRMAVRLSLVSRVVLVG